jgi:hypothetical protein
VGLMPSRIFTSPSLPELERLVNAMEVTGYRPTGQPFRDESRGLWCWAMTRPMDSNGEIRLREPVKDAERKGKR